MLNDDVAVATFLQYQNGVQVWNVADYKQLIDAVFVIPSIIMQGLGMGCQPKLKAEADNPYLDLDFSGYHQTESNDCL